MYVLQSFQSRVDETTRAVERPRVHRPSIANDQRNAEFLGSVSDRLLSGAQSRRESLHMSAIGGKADMTLCTAYVRF